MPRVFGRGSRSQPAALVSDRDGLLPAAISPDQLHFTELGYALLAARLDPELDRLLGPSR